MVNVIFYLNQKVVAESIIHHLLEQKLVAHASIDIDNQSYSIENGKLVQQVNFVVTAQTKAMLFGAIETFISEYYSDSVKIFSMPITQCNGAFFDYIASSTAKI